MMKVQHEFESKAKAGEYLSVRGWQEVEVVPGLSKWVNPAMPGRVNHVRRNRARKWFIYRSSENYPSGGLLDALVKRAVSHCRDQQKVGFSVCPDYKSLQVVRHSSGAVSGRFNNIVDCREVVSEVILTPEEVAAVEQSRPEPARYLPSRHPARQ